MNNLHILLIIFICFLSNSETLWPFKQSEKNSKIVSQKQLSPVIFIPGNGGSQLEAKLNKPTAPFLCTIISDWYNIWLSISLLVEPFIRCWIDNVKLRYMSTTRTTINSEGVDIRVPGWGNSQVVEWIDPSKYAVGAYFYNIANMLVTNGYSRHTNIYGAPYDFRKGPSELGQYFIDLKQLIEDAYESNYHTPVTLISHSMGSPMALIFLQQQTIEWKSKYIARQISLAGAWAGSMKALKIYAMGDNLDSYFLQGSVLKDAEITFPSIAWLIPSPLFWKSTEILVKTPAREYTRGNIQQYFKDINNENAWEMYKDNLPYILNFKAPEIELHCIYGNNVDTVERLQYDNDKLSTEPTLIMGQGDGTVNLRSLEACLEWKSAQTQNVSSLIIRGVNHMDLLQNKLVFDYIKNILISN